MTHNDNGPDPDRNYGETAVFIREIEKLSKITDSAILALWQAIADD